MQLASNDSAKNTFVTPNVRELIAHFVQSELSSQSAPDIAQTLSHSSRMGTGSTQQD